MRELSLDGLYGLRVKLSACVCVWAHTLGSVCEASVARFACVCVCVCVPCGCCGRAEGIRLTDDDRPFTLL